MIKPAVFIVASLISAISFACSGDIPVATDTESLSTSLSSAGLKVSAPSALGKIDAGLFSASGSKLVASSEELLAYEFATEDDAQAAASTVSPDGMGIGSKYINWTKTPHYFRSGRLIVIYDGKQSLIVDTLTKAMGPMFAGDASRQS